MLELTLFKADKQIPIMVEKPLFVQNITDCKDIFSQIYKSRPEMLRMHSDDDEEIDFSFCQLLFVFHKEMTAEGCLMQYSDSALRVFRRPLEESGLGSFYTEIANMMVNVKES